ncbi:MobF family relaxase [Spirillospora sp. NPDC052242]
MRQLTEPPQEAFGKHQLVHPRTLTIHPLIAHFDFSLEPSQDLGTAPNHHGFIWVGSGLPDLGITPGMVLDESQYPAARALMQGRHPHSLVPLVPVKQQVPDHAKVRGLPLVIAIEQTARARGINVDDLWTSNRQRATWERLRRQVHARPEQARIPADKAAVLLKRADLDPHGVYGPTFVEALSHADERVPVGNSGYDVTITFHKSFSALTALAPQPIAEGIEDCLRQASLDALALLEHHTAYAMRSHHGDGRQARTVPTSGFAGWMTTHRASRAGDPHWHVHFTLANMARAQDDKWSTIAAGGRDLMNHVHLAGAYAEARARHLLTQRHGLRFTRSDRTGRWEITGIPDRLLALWSKRDTEIRDLLNHQGTTWDDATPTAKRRAADRTRESKDPHLTAAADADLHHAWTTEARTAGLDPAAILNAALNPHHPTPHPTPPTAHGQAHHTPKPRPTSRKPPHPTSRPSRTSCSTPTTGSRPTPPRSASAT